MKNIIKKISKLGVLGVILSSMFANINAVKIVLDPGHGGNSKGCFRTYDEQEILEKDLNYKIACTIQENLKSYVDKNGDTIEVYLTHDNTDETPSLSERIELGVEKDADAVVSLHVNASSDETKNGMLVLVTRSNFNNLYDIEEKLAKCFVDELEKIGLKVPDTNENVNFEIRDDVTVKHGLVRRVSDDGTLYENGDITDWYGIIRNGILNKIPAILVEHGYLSNENDYRNFLSSNEQLEKLAEADTRAIVKYFDLVKKDIIQEN